MVNKKIPADAKKVFSTRLFQVYTKEMPQLDGSYKTFEWVRAYDIAKAICVVDDKIIILHEEFPGGSKINLPWGELHHDEDPDDCIRREVEEETGIVFWSFEQVLIEPCNVGDVEAYRYWYIARNPESFGDQNVDVGGEKIDVQYISFQELIDFAKQNIVLREFGPWILREYILPGKEDELKKLLFWS